MKVSIQRNPLHQAVGVVQRATAARVIQPILSNILMETIDSNTIRLSATDLDFSVQALVPATVLVEGRTTLSAKKLSEIISKLPGDSDVVIEADPETHQAHLTCGSSKFDVRMMPADEFPVIPVLDEAQYFDVSLPALLRAVQQTAFAAASQESNNVLGGVYFELDATKLEMAATDGSRLAKRVETLSASPVSEPVHAIIPARTLQELTRLGSGASDDDTARLSIKDGQISIRAKSFYMVSRLLDGQYPKYNQLIPADNGIVATANRQRLISCLERVAVMANERTNVVKLEFEPNTLNMVANTPDVGDSKDMLDVLYDGEPMNIAFNYKYVLDALKVIETDDVRVEMKGPLAPTLFKSAESADGNGSGEQFLCLVMPVQVK